MIRHIVAIDAKQGFAKAGKIPWNLPTDDKYFREETKKYGGVVLMGRRTFEALGGPLAGHQNFVLTRNPHYQAAGATVVSDLDSFLDTYPDVWILGGASLYEATIERADELYITEIAGNFDCDTFYPEYQPQFRRAFCSEPITENGVTYTFATYKSQHKR